MLQPYQILKNAIKANPALRPALAVVGGVAAVSIIGSLVKSYRVAILGFCLLLIGMVLFLLFAKLSTAKWDVFALAGKVLLWFSLLYMMSAMTLVFTGFFFEWPRAVAIWIRTDVLAYDIVRLPAYLKSIVQGVPKERCYTPGKGGGVELFEHGWMLVEFEPDRDNFYAIAQNPTGSINWFRTNSAWLDGNETPCPGVPNEELLRWGFRWWYCTNERIREQRGRPVTKETTFWPQFQLWTEGLLVVGVPTDPAGISTGKFNTLANIFLTRAEEHDSGPGQFNTVNAYNFNCKVYCNAVWYYVPTGPEPGEKQTNPQLQKEQGCPKIHTEQDFFQRREECSLCLE